MATGIRQTRAKLADQMTALVDVVEDESVKAAAQAWMDGMDDGDGTRERADAVLAAIEGASLEGDALKAAEAVLKNQDFLTKRSVWCLGGDGWSYDIGYGGLDHVLASGEDINVLVFDTEVYSNTGGQSSKATPTAAIAKFAASGKKTKKKDLGMMAKSYGYVYVAQCAMGADKNQFMKAVAEAEAYPGPSILICYAPCINHGLKKGMGKTQENQKDAVACGYWQLYRYNPALEAEGKNGFTLDYAKEPNGKFREFLMEQVRYNALFKEFPEVADAFLEKTEKDAMNRLAGYRKLAED